MAVPHDADVPAAGQPAYVATDTELAAEVAALELADSTHAADMDLHGGTAIAEHIEAGDPHSAYQLEAAHTLAVHTVLGLATGGDIPTAIAAHAAEADPHTGYLKEADHTLAEHNTLGLATQAELDAADAAIQTELDTKLGKTGGGGAVVSTVAASGAAETLDLTDGNVHDVTLTDNCTIGLSGATNGVECVMTIILRQDATGSRTATWPVTVEWTNGAPVLATAAGEVDVIVLFSIDGGSTWFGTHLSPAAILAADVTIADAGGFFASAHVEGALQELAASANGGLLGIKSYRGGSDAAVGTTSSTTSVDLHATNAAVTFTAPASGNVLVRLSGMASSGTSGVSYWQVREGSSVVGGEALVAQNVSLAHAQSRTFLITGLAPGSHTFKWGHRISNATYASGVFSGPTFGEAFMEVWQAP